MNETAINWTQLTWNPVSGCTKISPGCKFCYAETLSENKRGTAAFPNGFDLTYRPHKLVEPRKVKTPSLIFTNSMSDLFHEEIPDDYRDRIIDAMEESPHHRYQVLTKRPEVALAYSKRRKLPACIWMGTTIESQRYAGRADILRRIEASVRFVSAEPLLGALELNLDGIHWLISGGESGTHLAQPKYASLRSLARKDPKLGWQVREDRAAWVLSLRDQCQRAGVAFWHKQWGGTRPHSAGRMVEGRTWDELPSHVPGAMPAAYVHRGQTSLPLNTIAE